MIDEVLACIDLDRRAGRLAQWTRSTVIDENVGEAVIDTALFDALHAQGEIDAQYPVGNAGLIHVYGYLFSTLQTPYGLKSDRWTDGVLARTLGLPEGWFRLGDSSEETPLQRVLDVALPILTQQDARVVEWNVPALGIQRAVVHRAHDGSGALISGVDDGSGMRLLTVFPVADAAAFAETIGSPTSGRWNAASVL